MSRNEYRRCILPRVRIFVTFPVGLRINWLGHVAGIFINRKWRVVRWHVAYSKIMNESEDEQMDKCLICNVYIAPDGICKKCRGVFGVPSDEEFNILKGLLMRRPFNSYLESEEGRLHCDYCGDETEDADVIFEDEYEHASSCAYMRGIELLRRRVEEIGEDNESEK